MMLVPVTFGDFKPNELSRLVNNKDPLGLNEDIESYFTSEGSDSKAISEASEPKASSMEYDAIPHYLKMTSSMASLNDQENVQINPNIQQNINNNADSKAEENKEDSLPISQVNTHSSTGNLSRKVSFKSFKTITQSHKRSRTNSHDEIRGMSSDPIINVPISSNSDEIIDQFNNKTIEITKAMGELHFSTIDLRNKLSKGRTNNNCPIITQVFGQEAITQVNVDIYPPAQSVWREVQGFLHKEMNLRIKAAYYEALIKNNIYPPWTIAFQPPPNLMTNNKQADTIVALRKTQAKEILNTLSTMSNHEADECKGRADASTQALRAYYQQAGASQFNLNEALDALVALTDRSQRTVHSEQQKKFTELSNRPTLALYMGLADHLIPSNVKNQRLQPFMPPPREQSQSRPTLGGQKVQKNQRSNYQVPKRRPIQSSRVPPNKRGTSMH